MDRVEKVAIKTVIQTLEVIIGDLHLRPKMRLIDTLNTDDRFLAVTNAVVYDKSGKVRFSTRFLTINREQIVLVIPGDEMDRKQDSSKLVSSGNLLNRQKQL